MHHHGYTFFDGVVVDKLTRYCSLFVQVSSTINLCWVFNEACNALHLLKA